MAAEIVTEIADDFPRVLRPPWRTRQIAPGAPARGPRDRHPR